MNKKHWTCPEDIDADFITISDIYDNTTKFNHKPTFEERKARSKPSIYDDIPQEENSENDLYIPRGRGAGFLDKNFKLPVVGASLFAEKQDITRDIQEACGFRFSGGEIEKTLLNSPNSLNKLTSTLGDSFSSASSKMKDDEKPPPLYDIIKSKKPWTKHKTNENTHIKNEDDQANTNVVVRNKDGSNKFNNTGNARVENKIIDNTGMFNTPRKKYDINSTEDFPALH